MSRYYVNDHAQNNGDHEVHMEGCPYLSQARSTTYLGEFANCREAVAAAKRIYSKSDGCYHCCPACHHS